MVRESLGDDWDEHYPGWRSMFAEANERRIALGRLRYYFAEVDGEIVGAAGAQVYESFFGCIRGYVDGVYVRPSNRRQGIGSELMRECIKWLRAEQCDFVRLQATALGQPLYDSLGFTPTGEMQLTLNDRKTSYSR